MGHILLLIFLFNLVHGSEVIVSEKANDCPEHWLEAGSVGMGCIWINQTLAMSWYNANTYCQYKEATLVEIHTPEQLEYLRMELSTMEEYIGPADYWTGGTDIGSEGKWFWISSLTEVEEFVWYTSEPNQGYAANCLQLWSAADYKGADNACTDGEDHVGFYPICQKFT